jgi:hypothetical protein
VEAVEAEKRCCRPPGTAVRAVLAQGGHVTTISSAAGLVGHILEERGEPAARFIWELAEREVPYEPEE